MNLQLDLIGPEVSRQPASPEIPFRIIYTTKGHEVFVDEIDYERLSKFTWWITGNGYVYSARDYKHLSMHRVVTGITDPKITVDHKDRNKLNNRRENLRVCTQAKNTYNKGLNKNSTTGFKGVYFLKARGKYVAKIGIGYKSIHLGCFRNIEDAVMARDAASLKIHGEFGRLNSEIEKV